MFCHEIKIVEIAINLKCLDQARCSSWERDIQLAENIKILERVKIYFERIFTAQRKAQNLEMMETVIF